MRSLANSDGPTVSPRSESDGQGTSQFLRREIKVAGNEFVGLPGVSALQIGLFRPNEWRRLKTQKSARRVKLWPQLRDILQPYIFGGDSPPPRLLFPAYRRGGEVKRQDIRKLLERVLQRAGVVHVVDRGRTRAAQPTDLRTKIFRHTYITARLQTLDSGRQVSTYTVAREVGHSGTEMIERTYGHLAEVRHRSRAVEFRAHQHRKVLGKRLRQLTS